MKTEMKTIAQQLNITEFPFTIKDKDGNEIYTEYPDGRWYKKEYDSYRNPTLYENSNGYVENSGPKDGVAEIDDKECQLKEEMKRTLIIYNTKETPQKEAAHLLEILNCDDSMIWDNADRCGVEIIEVPTDIDGQCDETEGYPWE
jgi:hypothetical protein